MWGSRQLRELLKVHPLGLGSGAYPAASKAAEARALPHRRDSSAWAATRQIQKVMLWLGSGDNPEASDTSNSKSHALAWEWC